MSKQPMLVFVTASFAVAATAAAQNVPDRSSPPARQVPQHDEPVERTDECPTFVRGSKLAVSDVDRGVALRLTTHERAYVSELRQMIRELEHVLEEQAAAGAGGSAQVAIPPLDISVQDVAGGAIVTVRAKKSADVGFVREQARGVEAFWRTSPCITGRSPTIAR